MNKLEKLMLQVVADKGKKIVISNGPNNQLLLELIKLDEDFKGRPVKMAETVLVTSEMLTDVENAFFHILEVANYKLEQRIAKFKKYGL